MTSYEKYEISNEKSCVAFLAGLCACTIVVLVLLYYTKVVPFKIVVLYVGRHCCPRMRGQCSCKEPSSIFT
jgi:hypothetical protein